MPRVPGSMPFLKMISVADVMLHPFPFGGSKTSADALVCGRVKVLTKTWCIALHNRTMQRGQAMHIPLVVLKEDYLRGLSACHVG